MVFEENKDFISVNLHKFTVDTFKYSMIIYKLYIEITLGYNLKVR